MTTWFGRSSWLVALTGVLAVGCGSDDGNGSGGGGDGNGGDGEGAAEQGDVSLGETAIVTIVNPTPNDGNTAAVPPELGDERAGIEVDAEPGGADATDDDGLAVVQQLDAGSLDLIFGGPDGPAVPFDMVVDGDVYDLAVAYDEASAVAFENFPIRYAVGKDVASFGASASGAAVSDALSEDDTIVVLEEGRLAGDLTIAGENVLFFGEGFTRRRVVIDGSVRVRGGGVRIRGLTITGDVIAEGNGFGMAFSTVLGTTDIRGNAVAFLRNAFCGPVMVPSSSASLLDNAGMPPLPDPAEQCETGDAGAP